MSNSLLLTVFVGLAAKAAAQPTCEPICADRYSGWVNEACYKEYQRATVSGCNEQCIEAENQIYAGCIDDALRYLDECNTICSIDLLQLDLLQQEEENDVAVPTCFLPAEVGVCKAYTPRWYYNSTFNTGVSYGACQQFIYGGCGGNANNFMEEARCNVSCA